MEEAMDALSKEVRELSLGRQIERVEAPITPVRFLRDFVMPGKPCIVTGAINHWKALTMWSNDYLRDSLGEQPVSVHFTPDGRADSVVSLQGMRLEYGCLSDFESDFRTYVPDEKDHVFVSAHVEKMPFRDALDAILQGKMGNVAYAQEQNNCFRSEYTRLWEDAEVDLPWATEAFGALPDAVNLWIGNELAVTSFHKDHYENLYAVVSGEKHFTLLPPVDVHKLYVCEYPTAYYTRSPNGENFNIKLNSLEQRIPWVSVDPYPGYFMEEYSRQKYPRYFESEDKPYECTVGPGEILYLPSMWFHHVSQQPDPEGRTIAINFWYDMQYDIKYAYFQFLQSCVNSQRM